MQRNPQNQKKSAKIDSHFEKIREGAHLGEKTSGATGLGFCVCPKCGAETPHRPGFRCSAQKCPKCGAQMAPK